MDDETKKLLAKLSNDTMERMAYDIAHRFYQKGREDEHKANADLLAKFINAIEEEGILLGEPLIGKLVRIAGAKGSGTGDGNLQERHPSTAKEPAKPAKNEAPTMPNEMIDKLFGLLRKRKEG